MEHQEKIEWMEQWAQKNGVELTLEGEVGFGRPCVGISILDAYPDYHWYDDQWNRIDDNGNVWCPTDAYHKHMCVAVLGRGEDAETQLYEWLKWFDDNNFTVEVGDVVRDKPFHEIELLLGQDKYRRMVKKK